MPVRITPEVKREWPAHLPPIGTKFDPAMYSAPDEPERIKGRDRRWWMRYQPLPWQERRARYLARKSA